MWIEMVIWPFWVRIIEHPLIEMVSKVERTVAIGRVLEVNEPKRFAIRLTLILRSLIDQNVSFVDIIMTENLK